MTDTEPFDTGGFAVADPEVAARADSFRRLHAGPDTLVLPNVWDAGSAALVSQVPGVQAVGTTSAGMAAAQGLPDGEWLTLDQMLAVIEQITRASRVPVTVDLEAGYGRNAADVADSVASLIELGAVGANLEDGARDDPGGLISPDAHAERVEAACTAGTQSDVPIVVNARTDVYWRGVGAEEDRFDEAIRRLRLYREAGAQCLFLPGFPQPGLDRAERHRLIGELVAALEGTPLNLLAGPALPSVAELRELEVRRLSVGSALYRLGMAAVLDATGALMATGDQDALKDGGELSYRQLAELLPSVERS